MNRRPSALAVLFGGLLGPGQRRERPSLGADRGRSGRRRRRRRAGWRAALERRAAPESPRCASCAARARRPRRCPRACGSSSTAARSSPARAILGRPPAGSRSRRSAPEAQREVIALSSARRGRSAFYVRAIDGAGRRIDMARLPRLVAAHAPGPARRRSVREPRRSRCDPAARRHRRAGGSAAHARRPPAGAVRRADRSPLATCRSATCGARRTPPGLVRIDAPSGWSRTTSIATTR